MPSKRLPEVSRYSMPISLGILTSVEWLSGDRLNYPPSEDAAQ